MSICWVHEGFGKHKLSSSPSTEGTGPEECSGDRLSPGQGWGLRSGWADSPHQSHPISPDETFVLGLPGLEYLIYRLSSEIQTFKTRSALFFQFRFLPWGQTDIPNQYSSQDSP